MAEGDGVRLGDEAKEDGGEVQNGVARDGYGRVIEKKHEAAETKECPRCKGTGLEGGNGRRWERPRLCGRCGGTGEVELGTEERGEGRG
jgi:DnaJ-class molecular chaperone